MYMYDFFNSLDLLQQVPNINDLPRGNYLYFGICKKDELIQRGYKVSCDKLYLTYARYDDLSNLSYYPNDIFAPGWTVASLWELFSPGRAEKFLKK